eukprot:CAMPEP_0179326778 /NCGR_PEP_ID=MMETSP0797-20121207/61606_1 /TAXON_ID=47934 /ORGANISM="Dinophysis acuminata, Strain DAEP01" /LENGTH=88 /DNA_ID=CAMNT_0021039051 /DNA_START=42 /DNA_END=305 /DNA_ORIENTATION=-
MKNIPSSSCHHVACKVFLRLCGKHRSHLLPEHIHEKGVELTVFDLPLKIADYTPDEDLPPLGSLAPGLDLERRRLRGHLAVARLEAPR